MHISTKLIAFLFLALSGTLATAQTPDPVEIARQYVQENHSEWGLTAADVATLTVSDHYQTRHSGLTHVYFIQTLQDIDIFNAILNVNVLPDGGILYVGNRFVPDAAGKINNDVPTLSPASAIAAAAAHLELPLTDQPRQLEKTTNYHFIFSGGSVSRHDIPAELVFQRTTDGNLRLAWMLEIQPHTGSDYWNIRMDAATGEELGRTNYTVSCRFDHPHTDVCGSIPRTLPAPPRAEQLLLIDDASYRVFPIPVESPLHGSQELVTEPANADASPFGWHDTDQAPGAEYTYTRGNNVWAFPDGNGDDQSDFDIDGGATLTFDWAYDADLEPQQQKEAATTNLFYLNNIMHDVFYVYGFNEEAGNFQENNYGNPGDSGDPVLALGSYGSDDPQGNNLNNANFTTPPDGSSGSMRMYLWNTGARLVEVSQPSVIAGLYTAGTAEYGPSVYDQPVTGPLVQMQDDVLNPYFTDGCEEPDNAAELEGAIAIVDRGGCFFEEKTAQAEAAGAIGVIICNFEDGVIPLGGTADPDPDIPTVSMRASDCAILRQYLDDGIVISLGEPTNAGPEYLTGDFDNVVIAHEYAHGITNRLTGGPSATSCLPVSTVIGEQMGEGWSDFFAIVLTTEPGDQPEDPRGIATYLRRENPLGKGERAYPYTIDMSINPLTYLDIVSASVPHGVGAVWCSMLWDLHWAFVDEYGWDPDIYYGTGGNNMVIQLVVDALKIQPCEPGFVDGRDAILAADEALYGGIHQCLIWEVFARRGLGYQAEQGATWDNRDGTASFEPLPTCIAELKISKEMDNFIDAGDEVEVELYVVNHKPEAATNVVLTDELPDGLTYIAGSATIEPSSINGNILTWELGALAFGEEVTIEYEAQSSLNNFSTRHYYDDFEVSNSPYWGTTYIGIEAPNYWTNTSLFSYSGDRSYFVENISQASHQVLRTIFPILVPEGDAALRFYHRYDTEPGTDAGLVEISTDLGNTWIDIGDLIFVNPYVGQVDYNTFVVPNIEGFWGNSGGWIPTYADLSAFSGENIMLRFRFGTNESVGYFGWFVDDVELMEVFTYNAEACVSSDEGDEACAMAAGRGTIVESQMVSSTEEQLREELRLQIFPNPATNELTVGLEVEGQTSVHLELLSVDGRRLLYREQQAFNATLIALDVSALPSGMYFLQLRCNGKRVTEKVIIQ